ncbi:MAG: hypothetical protein K5770_10825 [Lachnospiraceae bacterium]|nr:hypothetical protein [Lachnospiraceae bacterium]
MKESEFNEIKRKFREQAKNAELADADMAKAIGGVGGPDEATCPVCGKPMKGGVIPGIGNGWTCEACGISTDMSDAETIQLIRYMEQTGVQDIGYPVWWPQVNH